MHYFLEFDILEISNYYYSYYYDKKMFFIRYEINSMSINHII